MPSAWLEAEMLTWEQRQSSTLPKGLAIPPFAKEKFVLCWGVLQKAKRKYA